MFNLGDLLKSKDPNIEDKLTDVASNSWADKFGANPKELTSEQIDALNQNPDILDRINKARSKISPSELPEQLLENSTPSMSSESLSTNTPKISIDPDKVMVPYNSEKSLAPIAKEESLISKFKDVPEETLAKLGPLGKKIMDSRAAGMLGKVASSPAGKFAGEVGLPLVGSAMEASQIAPNLEKGNYMDAAMNTAGAAAGPAMIASSAAAGPLLAVSGGYGAGKMVNDMMGGAPPPLPSPSDPNAPPSVPPIGPGGIMPPNQDAPPALADKDEPEQLPTQGKQSAFLQKAMQLAALKGNSGRMPSSEPMPEGFTNNTVAKLQEQQDSLNKERNLNNAFKNLNQFSAGLLGGRTAVLKPDNSFFDEENKTAEGKLQQFKDRTDKEKDDPNSAYSQHFKAYVSPMLAKLGMSPDLIKNASASQIKELIPFTEKMYEGQSNRENRLEEMRQRGLDRQALLGSKKEEKTDASNTKRLDTVNKLITPGLASSRSPLGKDVGNLYAVQNARALLEGGNLDDVDNRQMAEVARVLDRVLSGGNPTISGTEHLTPETARMKAAKMMELITNKRQGAGASDFLKNNLHTFDREEKLAKDRILNTSREALASYRDIAERDPASWDRMMDEHGLLDTMGSEALKDRVKGSGGKTQKQLDSAAVTNMKFDDGMEEKIKKAMKKNNASREEVIQALKDAGKI